MNWRILVYTAFILITILAARAYWPADDVIIKQLTPCEMVGGTVFINQCPANWHQEFTYTELLTEKIVYPEQDIEVSGTFKEVKDVYAIKYNFVKYACCSEAPNPINDLAASTMTTAGAIRLSWTAPAGYGGQTVDVYDIRFSQNPIAEENFESAHPADELGGTCLNYEPHAPGYSEECTLLGLTGNGQQYYFAIKSKDNRDLWSDMSNVASAPTLYADIGVDDIEVSKNGQTSSYTIYLYDNIDVKAHVTNHGNLAETTTVYLKRNAQIITSQQVTLTPSETKLVSFVWTPSIAEQNVYVKVFAESSYGDMNSSNNQQQSLQNVWSVLSSTTITFKNLYTDPVPHSVGDEINNPFNAKFTLNKPGTMNFYSFSATLVVEGLVIDSVTCTFGGVASPDKKTCTWDLIGSSSRSPTWTLHGTPGQIYDISLQAGNLGDVATSGVRTVHFNPPVASAPTTTLPKPKEPGLPLITSRAFE